MSIQELLPILQKVSADILIFSIIVFILTNLLKKRIPEKYSHTVSILPFILGITLISIYSLCVLKIYNLVEILKKGVQVGGLATFIYAFIKQLLKEKVVEKNISDILKGILDAKTIKKTVKEIVNGFSLSVNVEESSKRIYDVLLKNTTLGEKECLVIKELIMTALLTK